MRDKGEKIIKIIRILIGLFIAGLGTAFLFQVGWGSAPTSTIIEGVANFFNIGFGPSSFAINIIFLVLLIIFDRSLIGVGTILAALFLGIFIDLGTFLIEPLSIPEMTRLMKVPMMLAGCVLTPLGLGYYMGQFFGVGAVDSIAVIIFKRLNKIQFKYCRWGIDLLLMVVGIILGAAWGIATIASFVFTGPIIQYVVRWVRGKSE